MNKTLHSNYNAIENQPFLTPKEAALWASSYLGKKVTSSNIAYLINYGKIANHAKNTKESLVCKEELQNYYDVLLQDKELSHPLSFCFNAYTLPIVFGSHLSENSTIFKKFSSFLFQTQKNSQTLV